MSQYRDGAEPIAEEIMRQICNHLRYKMSVWPKEEDIKDMKRVVKSIIVQDRLRRID